MPEENPHFRVSDFLAPCHWPTWLLFGILRLLAFLPFSTQMTIGRGLGRLFYYLIPSRRHVAAVNIKLCMPTLSAREQKKLLRKHYQSLGMSIMEMAAIWFMPTDKLLARTQFIGKQHLDDARATGRGVLVIQAHFTTMEFLGNLLATQLPIAATYDKPKNQLYKAILNNRRARFVDGIISHRDVRQVVKRLRAGKVTQYSPDQSAHKSRAAVVEYFGRATLTTTSTSRLARAGNALVVPYIPRRNKDNQSYEIEFYPALDNFPSDDLTADTQRINHIFESHVQQVPEQYFWVHKRFKKSVANASNPY